MSEAAPNTPEEPKKSPVAIAPSLWPTTTRGGSGRSSKRKGRRGSVVRARVMLVVIFLLFRGLDVWYWIGPSSVPKERMSAILVGSGLWLSALLLAIWLRQKWARYIFIAVMWMAIIWLMIIGSDMLMYRRMLPVFSATGVIMAGCAAWMGYSRDAHRLTDREYK